MRNAPGPPPAQTVTPSFTVSDADRLIIFARAVFGATLIKEDRYENGRIQHARLKIGNSVLMLNEATADYRANASQMHIYVPDADSAYVLGLVLALENGATPLMPPNDRPHGDRMAGVTDPCGNIWWIASSGP